MNNLISRILKRKSNRIHDISSYNTDNNDIKTCRICHETEGSLIYPCACQGTLKYVHIRCLRDWVKYRPKKDRHKCEVCLSRYIIKKKEKVSSFRRSTNKIKKKIFKNFISKFICIRTEKRST